MSEFITILAKTWDFLKINMNIYGFNLSYWGIALWSSIAVLLVSFIVTVVVAASHRKPKGKK